ncbi:anaerobic sulfatase maturase [Planctomycetota bacterium]
MKDKSEPIIFKDTELMQPFTLLIKPSGSDCNLDCKYCFYKNRAPQIGFGKQRMSDDVLGRLVKDYMQTGFDVCGFSFQGGEPTLMGLDFYKKVVQLQKVYARPGRQVSNSLQTNAVLLDGEWCSFLHENKFLVGISIDGPKEWHDYYRLDHAGSGTFDKVLKAIQLCKEYKVEFNALVLLNNINAEHPDELFDFFLENDIRYLQFIPCVELDPDTGEVADYSVTPQQLGAFLCRTFDRWFEYGPRKLFIRDFESIISFCATGRHTICTFNRQCSDYIVVEHTGDCFVCDFFVEPKWYLGNILDTPIKEIASSGKKLKFARLKKNLSNKCLLCRQLDVCRGGCMKDRIPFDKNDFGNESYLCQAYKKFFDYSMPRFMQLAAEITAPLPDE